jgi:hypothetical protein
MVSLIIERQDLFHKGSDALASISMTVIRLSSHPGGGIEPRAIKSIREHGNELV